MIKDMEFVPTGFSCFDEVSGGLPQGKLTWIWGALPLVEENLWFGLSLALEAANRNNTTIAIVCSRTDPMILKNAVQFVYPGLEQKLQTVEADSLNASAQQTEVCLIDARIADGASLRAVLRALSAGLCPEILVMESITAISEATGTFDHEFFAHLEEYANETRSGIVVIPFGSTYALRQFETEDPTSEVFRKELYCHRPAGEHSGLNVYVVPEGEMQSPIIGYNKLGTVRLDVARPGHDGIEFIYMRYLRKETRQAEMTYVDQWSDFVLRNIVKYECGSFDIVWKD